MEERLVAGWPEKAWAAFVDAQFSLQHRHLLAGHADADFLVVSRSGRPIGRVYLDRSRSTWRILEIAIDPTMRRRGVGTALLHWVIRRADAADAGVDLHVAHDNAPASRLYHRLGFVPAFEAGSTHRRLIRPPPRRRRLS